MIFQRVYVYSDIITQPRPLVTNKKEFTRKKKDIGVILYGYQICQLFLKRNLHQPQGAQTRTSVCCLQVSGKVFQCATFQKHESCVLFCSVQYSPTLKPPSLLKACIKRRAGCCFRCGLKNKQTSIMGKIRSLSF